MRKLGISLLIAGSLTAGGLVGHIWGYKKGSNDVAELWMNSIKEQIEEVKKENQSWIRYSEEVADFMVRTYRELDSESEKSELAPYLRNVLEDVKGIYTLNGKSFEKYEGIFEELKTNK